MTGNLLQDYSTCKEHYQPNYGFCTFLSQYPATMVMGSLYSIVIIQGLLLVGVIDKKSTDVDMIGVEEICFNPDVEPEMFYPDSHNHEKFGTLEAIYFLGLFSVNNHIYAK